MQKDSLPHSMEEKNQFGQTLGDAVANWSPRPRPSVTSMQGQYCVLKPLDIVTHGLSLFTVLQGDNSGESWTYLPYGPYATFKDFSADLHRMNQNHDTLFYVIIDIKKKDIVGLCAYLRINPEHGVVEVGHLHYSKRLQKTPAATEAMFLMMSHVFDDLGYRRYEWKCNALNLASSRAAERLGFKFEGIFRQANVFKGRNRDTAWFSILDHEWPLLKRKFQKWLAPDNFDELGQQRARLETM